MSGSINVHVYLMDDGKQVLVRLDESNAALGGFAKPSASFTPSDLGLIRDFDMRYVNLYGEINSRPVTRKLYIADPTNDLYRNGGQINIDVDGAAVPFRVQSSRGEDKSFFLLGIDTGQDDGDQP